VSTINVNDVHGSFNGSGGAVIGDGNTVIVGARDGDDRLVDVKLERVRPSVISRTSSGWVAAVAAALTALTGVYTALTSPAAQPVTVGATEVTVNWWGSAVTLGLGLLGWAALTFWKRRRHFLPKISRRGSLMRSLIPADFTSGRYVRAKASAQCSACRQAHRDNWAPIRRDKHGVYYRCKLKHRQRFNEHSLSA